MTDSHMDVFACFDGLDPVDVTHTPGPRPYDSDLHHLHDACHWVLTRCRRLRAERLASHRGTEADLGDETRWRLTEPDRRLELQRTFQRLAGERHDQEHALRSALDARRTATRDAGRTLALDQLCTHHQLGDLERLTLLLAVTACIDREVASALPKLIDAYAGFTPAIVMTFAELTHDARLAARRHFRPDAPLRRLDLLALVDPDDTDPATFYDPALRLTRHTFDQLIGESDSPFRDPS